MAVQGLTSKPQILTGTQINVLEKNSGLMRILGKVW